MPSMGGIGIGEIKVGECIELMGKESRIPVRSRQGASGNKGSQSMAKIHAISSAHATTTSNIECLPATSNLMDFFKYLPV